MVNEFDRIFEQNEKERQRKKLICELVAEDMYVPMKEKELAAFMQVPREEKEEFRRILQALVAEGRLQVSAQGRYGKPDDNRLVGIYTGTARGFGFVEVEGRDDDLYIPEDKRGGAFHQDRVQVMLLPGRQGKRQEACVVQVLERGLKQVVGTWEQCENFGFVIPDNSRLGTDIFVPQERSRGAVTGHKVVVELVSYGDEKHKPEGKVAEILGHINDPGVDIMSVVHRFELPTAFGEKVMHQADRVPETVQEADRAGRMDLTALQMVTIDGEDAKDLDDAV
ncbi:MAG: ribonuclease R, partial [Lachnospiraceae bacterium]|nr:ribonuclease R [Lachnospiraceae bacterium]